MVKCIPFTLINLENDSYHIAISCEINNNKGEMIIDTGASKTVIDDLYINKNLFLSNETKNVISSGLGGEINLKLAKLLNFKIANLNIPEFTVAVMDLSYINNIYLQYKNKQIMGLLGSDFLLKYKASIDYEKKIMSLSINS